MTSSRVVGLLIWIAVAVPNPAGAADPAAGWRGVKVMPKLGCKVLAAGGRAIADKDLGVPYVVQNVNGQWLWVGDHEKGWVLRSQVVTLDEALAYYTRVLQTDPANVAWAYSQRAVTWKEKGEVDLAIADYGERLRRDPDAIAYNNRGVGWRSKKEDDKAISDYDQAIRLDPTFTSPLNNRGVVWNSKKEYDKAIADYDQAIRLDPDFALAYENRGDSRANKKEYDRAIADFDQAIRLDPSRPGAYVSRGGAYDKKKEYSRAIVDYAQAMSLNPRSPDAYNAAAWLRATCPDASYRDGEKAVRLAQKACELTKWKNAFANGTLGAAYAEQGDFERAIKFQQKAIELNASDAKFVKEGQERLELYRDKKPFRDTEE